MPNWGDTMVQDFEFWEVDKNTWGDSRRIDSVLSCKGTRDMELATRETAEIQAAEQLEMESVVRCYMTTLQGRVRERFPIGTWMVQGSSKKADGLLNVYIHKLHSPLMVLHDRSKAGAKAPIGYSVPAGANCASACATILRNHGVAPVVATASDKTLEEAYVTGTRDCWLAVSTALAETAQTEIAVDPWGRIEQIPARDLFTLAPAWTFADDDDSILLPEATEELDLYDVPNVCEVVWNHDGKTVVGRAENNDINSPVSTSARGYEVVLRLDNPEGLQAGCTQETANLVALQELRKASVAERNVTISHGWCPVRLGDPVRVAYEQADIWGDGYIRSMDFEIAVGMTATSKIAMKQEVWR